VNAPRRAPRRAVHGVLVLDKPLGLSSTAALAKAKWLLQAEKAGHAGTLDPLATGVLPLCFGAATKLAQAGLDADKRYRATLQLGETRVGGDREGEVLRTRPLDGVDRAAVERALPAFTGALEQRPPMHSAVKVDGKPLYAYARKGIEIERAARAIAVHALELVSLDPDGTLVLDVACSKGTYVRTLAEDLGEALGCGAHLAGLRRTGAGPFAIERATSLDALEAMPPEARDALLLPADALVAGLPSVALPADEAGRFLTGLRRRVALADAERVRVYGPPLPSRGSGDRASFLGIARIRGGELIATRLLSPAEVSP
jgi:tRNA pseudouridine55 synthase